MRYLNLIAFLLVLTIGVSCKKSEKTTPGVYKFTISLNGTIYSWTGKAGDAGGGSCVYSGNFGVGNVSMGQNIVPGSIQCGALISLNQAGLGSFVCNSSTATAAVPNYVSITLSNPTSFTGGEIWTTAGGSVTVNITEVSPNLLGIVKGNFSGTVKKFQSNNTATVSGTFEASNTTL
jgi:hypothetical protein